jgi:hypothetical protein
MGPARFDPVARARQIVYSYVPCDPGDRYAGDESMPVALAQPLRSGSICISARGRTDSQLVSRIITLVQIGLVSAIAANLGFIAAR